MNDWYEPRDKGPQIEEPNRHRRKRASQKPFIIQYRYIGPIEQFLTNYYASKREWTTYQRYETERGRDQAFATLERKRLSPYSIFTCWQYRIPENK